MWIQYDMEIIFDIYDKACPAFIYYWDYTGTIIITFIATWGLFYSYALTSIPA